MIDLLPPREAPQIDNLDAAKVWVSKNPGYYANGVRWRVDAFYTTDGVYLQIQPFPVLKTTPAGVVIGSSKPRFVNDSWNKRYAVETPAAALASFVARKERQIQILEAQLARARSEMEYALAINLNNGDDK